MLAALLKEQGVEVLDVLELLEEAVVNARRTGELKDWVRRTFPVTADRLIERLDCGGRSALPSDAAGASV